MKNLWWQSLIEAQGDGSALTNTTTPTSLLPGQAKFTLPAGFLDAPGAKLKVKAAGRISTAASSPGTLTLDVRFGSTVVFNGGASGTLATSATNLTWEAEIELLARSVGSGSAATILGIGKLISAALSASTPVLLLPASAPAVGTGFDSTVSNTVDLFATWSVASASNSIQLHQFELVSCY